MSAIYADQHKPLAELLLIAGEKGDATLLIPDLQRPYVWKPAQVVSLVDSLLRGWPFGTLLTWEVGSDDPARSLARPFWSTVDRTEIDDGEQATASHPPAPFHMVLDGQQRVQSLLIALAGDGWGFKMLDKEWREHLEGATPRGPRGPAHWSKGCLCVDLKALTEQFAIAKRAAGIDYNQVLRWVVTDAATGQSAIKKPDTYVDALPSAAKQPGQYLRLSRLWVASPQSGGLDYYEAEDKADSLLRAHGVADQLLNEARRPLGAVIMALQSVKQTRVTYLELARFDDAKWTRNSYDDAIVNIFTRLNTGGRTLTHEDITFAWLKIGWNKQFTGGSGAQACIDELRSSLASHSINIGGEDAVAAISYIWATAHRGGILLEKKDLLRGDAIRPMASDVSRAWAQIKEAISRVSEAIRERELRFRDHYASLNSLIYLWAWYYLGIVWRDSHQMKEGGRQTLESLLDRALAASVDQWLIASQWAGIWTDVAAAAWPKYAVELSVMAKEAESMADPISAAGVLRNRLERNIRDLEQKAIDGVNSLRVYDRGQVRRYSTALWLWNRLDIVRWEAAKVALRKNSKKDPPAPEVDHVVAYNFWCTSLQQVASGTTPEPDVDSSGKEDVSDAVNGIGNCFLLAKSFNISKLNRPLKELLLEIHPFSAEPADQVEEKILAWAKALDLPLAMVERKGSLQELADSFENRANGIRRNLEEFIKGQRRRVDL